MAMIPTLNSNTVKGQSGMWIEEMIPHYFRLYTQNRSFADIFNIRCPRCGTALKYISASINETKRGMYAAPVPRNKEENSMTNKIIKAF